MLMDYARDYFGTPFSQVGANALDLLVLSEMTNFEYDDDSIGKPMADAIDEAVLPTIENRHGEPVVSLENKEDLELAQLVKRADRYRDAVLRDFEARYVEGSQQFGALAVEQGGMLCVAFRATDLTVTGWHESLKLSENQPTGSQLDAAAFLERNYADWNGPVLVCGHSKGGNLAEFACRELVDRYPDAAGDIVDICSFDGPGLAPHYRDTDAYRLIAPKIHTFIPKSSIVGNIHEHPRAGLAYVDSAKPFVMQHYVYNWKTRGTHLIRAHQTMVGRMTSGLLNLLIDITDDAAKHRIFQTLFAPYRLLGRRLL
ncbi:Mbeg1-like protein [Bifidobacterium choloepi]|uniref:DUF2974 domain-containing protein n=1 Tax=Bifidobacterium choloepi TaxID=2614131 RepID=A0A6I5N664_9BIFI|nr:Mbeg1-like protein [Bifidobacterium choloepi]NEG69281.1 DUF2974 domain-containing protein [Bifidobacterium choloepi]